MQQQEPRSADLEAIQSSNAERMRRHRASLTEEQKAEIRAKDAARMAATRKALREKQQQPQKVDAEALDAQGQQRARKLELQRERRRIEKANRDATKLRNEKRQRKDKEKAKRDAIKLRNEEQNVQEQQPRTKGLKAVESANTERMRQYRASLTEEQKTEIRAKNAAREAVRRKALRAVKKEASIKAAWTKIHAEERKAKLRVFNAARQAAKRKALADAKRIVDIAEHKAAKRTTPEVNVTAAYEHPVLTPRVPPLARWTLGMVDSYQKRVDREHCKTAGHCFRLCTACCMPELSRQFDF